MDFPITTSDKVISVKGKVMYNDRKRRIDLKRPIRDLFDAESMSIFYQMELCLSEPKAVERIRELSSRNVIPVLLYFLTENEMP